MSKKISAHSIISIFFLFTVCVSKANTVLRLLSISEIYKSTEYNNQLSNISEIIKGDGFIKMKDYAVDKSTNVHWMRFNLTNSDTAKMCYYINFGYTNEDITLYQLIDNRITNTYKSGVLVASNKKNALNSRTEFIKIELPRKSNNVFFTQNS